MKRRTLSLVIIAGIFWSGSLAAAQLDTGVNDAVGRLRDSASGPFQTHLSVRTGRLDFVKADRGEVLQADSASAEPESRARAFLARHGALLGLTEGERTLVAPRGGFRIAPAAASFSDNGSELRVKRIDRDPIGETHVRMSQFYRGLPVFGTEIIVHMNEHGITGVNGAFVPGLRLSTTPRLDSYDAIAIALTKAGRGGELPEVGPTELVVYRTGLLEGFEGDSLLAWSVDLKTGRETERVILDANSGAVLLRYSLHPDALYRKIYSPSSAESDLRRKEGDAPTFLPPVDNLYDFAGQVYGFFKNAFGRDSYDGTGKPMRSVYLVNEICPNAYWSPADDTTNYCPGFDADDIVAHEWGHAYTSFTHNLIYAYQSGALNESYSDIWGETVDLNNGRDTLIGGTNNTQPHPVGQRWIIGEDLVGPAHNSLLTRDMWDPDRLGSPGKVSSENYACGSGDYGGVHTNSGVPNHAFAMLVDGATYNGQTVGALGFTRAINIYFRAMTAYQVPTTNFAEHEVAMTTSCSDLIGKPLKNFTTGLPSTDVINDGHCTQVANAMKAVEMGTLPEQCNYQPQLQPNAPPKCVRYETLYADDFESGLDGWTLERRGPRDFNWVIAGDLPQGRSGSAAFAIDADGTCGEPGTAFSMTSPSITIPALVEGEGVSVRFDHLVETEQEWDGGNVKISVNGSPFTIVPDAAYTFNAPSRTLLAATDANGAPQNTNPLAGERAFTGTDGGKNFGSWGTSIIDLSSLASTGDSVQIKLDFGFDGCAAINGWFVDDFTVYTCPAVSLLAPHQNAIGDDAYPDQSDGFDRDGSYTVSWSQPAGGEPACGFLVEEARLVSAAPFTDDAEETLIAGSNSTWAGGPNWISEQHPSTGTFGYHAVYLDNSSTTLTMLNPFTIPEGAGAMLTFQSFEDVEAEYDFVYVDVSTNGGTTFTQVFTSTGTFSGERSINLSKFEGETILVRFRVVGDIYFSFPLYQGWYIDDIAIRTTDKFLPIGTVGAATNSFAVTGKTDGVYSYRVSALFGECGTTPNIGPASNIEQIAVSVVPTLSPSSSFRMTPNPAEENTAVAFDGSASADNDSIGSGSGIVSYRWSFGDGATATTSSPTTSHTYATAGEYRVTLTVTDNDGQSASSEQQLQVFVPRPVQTVGSGQIAAGSKKGSFAFDVSRDGTSISGTLSYQEKGTRYKVSATSITSFQRDGNRVQFGGTCSVNKVNGYTFTVDVEDNGSGSADRFTITVSDGYSAGGTLERGDIRVTEQ